MELGLEILSNNSGGRNTNHRVASQRMEDNTQTIFQANEVNAMMEGLRKCVKNLKVQATITKARGRERGQDETSKNITLEDKTVHSMKKFTDWINELMTEDDDKVPTFGTFVDPYIEYQHILESIQGKSLKVKYM